MKPLKLSHKLAGIFGTGAFVLVGLTTYLNTMNPFEMFWGVLGAIVSLMDYLSGGSEFSSTQWIDTSLNSPLRILQWGILGAAIGGGIGYMLGDILANPKGNASPTKDLPSIPMAPSLPSLSGEPDSPAMTGNETFLDDVDE